MYLPVIGLWYFSALLCTYRFYGYSVNYWEKSMEGSNYIGGVTYLLFQIHHFLLHVLWASVVRCIYFSIFWSFWWTDNLIKIQWHFFSLVIFKPLWNIYYCQKKPHKTKAKKSPLIVECHWSISKTKFPSYP